MIYATVQNSIHYNVFYKTALKLLELDPMREIAVAVSTSILPENNVVTPCLQLITANGTIVSFQIFKNQLLCIDKFDSKLKINLVNQYIFLWIS